MKQDTLNIIGLVGIVLIFSGTLLALVQLDALAIVVGGGLIAYAALGSAE